MALNDIERKRIEKMVDAFVQKRRPPGYVRPQLDVGFRVTGQSVEIFQIRPRWNKPDEKIEESVAKATLVRGKSRWKILWKRADLKWHSYEPVPEVDSLDEFLAVVEKDECSCFWG